MAINLFDLAGNDTDIRFSPYCWSAKMALLHKGVDFDTTPWFFTEKSATEESGCSTVPVIKHEQEWISDSWNIAEFLDKNFPEAPALIGEGEQKANVERIKEYCSNVVFPAIVPVIVKQVHDILSEPCQAYFRETREAFLGTTLENASATPEEGVANLAKALEQAESELSKQAFLGGEAPDYSDYLLFGTLKLADIVSKYEPIEKDTAVGKWFEKMNQLFNGYAAKAKKVRG